MINKITITEKDSRKYDVFMERVRQNRHYTKIRVGEAREAQGDLQGSIICYMDAEREKDVPISMYQYKDGKRELSIFTISNNALESIIKTISSISHIKLSLQDVRPGEVVLRLA